MLPPVEIPHPAPPQGPGLKLYTRTPGAKFSSPDTWRFSHDISGGPEKSFA